MRTLWRILAASVAWVLHHPNAHITYHAQTESGSWLTALVDRDSDAVVESDELGNPQGVVAWP